jgi:hypothetical protein
LKWALCSALFSAASAGSSSSAEALALYTAPVGKSPAPE